MSECPDITHAFNTVRIEKAALTAQLCHHLVALEPKISPPIRGLLPHARRSTGQHMPPHEAFKFAQQRRVSRAMSEGDVEPTLGFTPAC